MTESQSNTPPNHRAHAVAHNNERLIFFSDGIFAITITLLVLEIHVPEIAPELVSTQLTHALTELLPKVLGHVISFAVLGLYWIAHHNAFMHIKRHDRLLMWLNILFLLCVASMPFPTGLVIQYGTTQIAILIYAIVLALAGFTLDTMWWYATTHNLVDEDTDPEFIAFAHRKILLPPIVYLIAAGASFVSVSLAKFLIIGVIALYILPNPLDRYYFSKHYKQLSRRFEQ